MCIFAHRYRMFAHKANPLENEGDGVMAWTPFRERSSYGQMYQKVITADLYYL